MGSVTSPPLTNVQTVSVPPGGATIVDFKIDRAGHYVLVDHALSRAERGLAGYLIVDGPEDDAIMHKGPADAAPGEENEQSVFLKQRTAWRVAGGRTSAVCLQARPTRGMSGR